MHIAKVNFLHTLSGLQLGGEGDSSPPGLKICSVVLSSLSGINPMGQWGGGGDSCTSEDHACTVSFKGRD